MTRQCPRPTLAASALAMTATATVLVGAAALAAGCNTVEGVGRDISAIGRGTQEVGQQRAWKTDEQLDRERRIEELRARKDARDSGQTAMGY